MQAGRIWIVYAGVTVVLWGVWGALTGQIAARGFPDGLIYVIWSITMLPPALWMLKRRQWRLERDRRSLLLGLAIGLLGAGGQMLLFYVVTIGPTYLIFPMISLSPVVTILLSMMILGERTDWKGAVGIGLALLALPMLNYEPAGGEVANGWTWFGLALLVLVDWGAQGYYMKLANHSMSAEGIFVYMALTGVALVPVALALTPGGQGWAARTIAGVAAVQLLNSVGALALVFAFRYGKAIVVAPLANGGAPLLTAGISLAFWGTLPPPVKAVGMGVAIVAALLLAISSEEQP